MKKTKNILILIVILMLSCSTNIYAHGGNISGWKDRNSSKIIEYDGKFYGYHNEDGVKHYHQVEWDDENQKWKILNPAVYYDENFNVIDNVEEKETKKVEVKYNKKVDGDTAKFELDGKIITVRFLGINTPETVDKTRGEEPYGKEASDYTEQKLKNANKIELEYDSNALEKDKYDRTLAWIWIDDSLLQKELVENGLAETYMLQNNYKYAGVLQLAEAEAKKNKVGIWSNTISDDSTKIENSIDNDNNNVDKDTTVFIMIIILIMIVIFLKYLKRR